MGRNLISLDNIIMYTDKILLAAKGFARAFPFVTPFFSFILGIIFERFVGIYFCFMTYGLDLLNHFTKKIMRTIYGDRESFPLIGIGKRPKGARHCGVFVEDDGDGISTGFGMPSGHAQVAMITLVFWTLYLLENNGYNNRTYFSICLLTVICIGIVVSRVLLGCHTIQQIVIGACIGLILGYLGYKVYKKLVEFIKGEQMIQTNHLHPMKN